MPVQLSLIGRADERLQRGVIEFAEIRRALRKLLRFFGAEAIAHKVLKRTVVKALQSACAHGNRRSVELRRRIAPNGEHTKARRAFAQHPLGQRSRFVAAREPFHQGGQALGALAFIPQTAQVRRRERQRFGGTVRQRVRTFNVRLHAAGGADGPQAFHERGRGELAGSVAIGIADIEVFTGFAQRGV